VTYAALADWTPQDSKNTRRVDVLGAIRDIGPLIKESHSKMPIG